jgi:cysteine desulfuration protein SufE
MKHILNLAIFAERNRFTMTIKEKQQEIIDEFAFLEDWEQKYEYIIDLGKELKGLSDDKKTEENLIKGCQSKVWIDEFKDGKLFLRQIRTELPKGIVSLLVSIYSGHSTEFWILILIYF